MRGLVRRCCFSQYRWLEIICCCAATGERGPSLLGHLFLLHAAVFNPPSNSPAILSALTSDAARRLSLAFCLPLPLRRSRSRMD